MPKIKILTNIKADKKLIFNLKRSIDLHKVSTHKSKEKAIAGKTSGLLGLNESVTWRAKHFGVYHKLSSKITAFDFPNYFVDEMQKGIFKQFRHEHHFEDNNNSTLMTDIFDYTAPLGFLGKLADTLFLKTYMQSFLYKRNQIIKEYAESEKWKTIHKDFTSWHF